MNRKFIISLLLSFVLVILVGYGVLVFVIRQEVDLNYVGDILIEDIWLKEDKLWVSYATEGGRWRENSARIYLKTKAEVFQDQITISVITTLPFEGYKSLYYFQVQGVKEGNYQLNYVNPDGDIEFVRNITIPAG